MRVIEAFLAAMLILACLTIIPPSVTPKNTTNDFSEKAQNVLSSLDSDGQIARLVENQDWVGLKDSLESALSLTMWFNLTVCDGNQNVLNPYPICSGGVVSNQITSVTYVCASQNSTYAVYALQLQLAAVN